MGEGDSGSQAAIPGKLEYEAPKTIFSGEPIVKLLAYTENPYALSVASARTCYSPKVIFASEVNEGQKDRIGKAIFEAGHHTPFQHPTFVFGIENVSRQFVWSFLHSHPYYNSDQSSQRYNVLNEARAVVPAGLKGEAKGVYEKAVLDAWGAYNRLSKILVEDNFRLMENIGRMKKQNEKQIRTDAEKKSIENARYVLPVAAFTSLYHTVSGIVLQRYARIAGTGDCPSETRKVVSMMIEEVKKIDPDFFGRIGKGEIAENELPESKMSAKVKADANFAKKFDAGLGGYANSKLISFDAKAEEIVAESVREVFGVGREQLSEDEAIDAVVNPKKNQYLLDTLNVWQHSPLMRSLNHVNYTFRKRISHTADSQNQRHRATPGSRPLLTRVHTREPDYVMPEVIGKNKEAKGIYEGMMKELWDAKNKLIGMGVAPEFACYLLPNAVNVRFTESGSLIGYMHKWRMRTCFVAQNEICDASMQELEQAVKVHPRLTKYIGPPCTYRNGLVENRELEGPCPEGPRWCGIKVWLGFPKVKRPF
ncbi:Thymidylate synthase ThyX [Candidatus Gugararchaeum adminiculabundum]|nr:Thymidylate synthase ThyX [Candidatus Gugararchaeum adminiculabundum]